MLCSVGEVRRRDVDMQRAAARSSIALKLRTETEHRRTAAVGILEACRHRDAVLPRTTHDTKLRHQHTRTHIYALGLNTHRKRVTAIVIDIKFGIGKYKSRVLDSLRATTQREIVALRVKHQAHLRIWCHNEATSYGIEQLVNLVASVQRKDCIVRRRVNGRRCRHTDIAIIIEQRHIGLERVIDIVVNLTV